MRVIVSGRKFRKLRLPVMAGAVALVVICGVVFFATRGNANAEDVAALPPSAEQTAVSAILGTLESFGARDVEDAVNIWAQGVSARNGMTQYAVMKSDLKSTYLELAESKFGGLLFPTGAARIDSWYVAEVNENEDGSCVARLQFTVSEGAGESVAAMAELTIEQEGDFTVVSSVAVEKALYEFTGIG